MSPILKQNIVQRLITYFSFTLITLVLVLSCSKNEIENNYADNPDNEGDVDSTENIVYQKNAKLKRVLICASMDINGPVWIQSEYKYDEEGRIKLVTSPMYIHGKIVGVIAYHLYYYNSQGQLTKIENFNSNSNSPTGFLNLSNTIYTYHDDGKLKMIYFEYPVIESFEYSLYYYENDKLKRIEEYDESDNLGIYIVNDYDNEGILVRETTYWGPDDHAIRYTQHTYLNGLIVRSDIYIISSDLHWKEIFRTYDENDNLLILESIVLEHWGSDDSYILRYEYY